MAAAAEFFLVVALETRRIGLKARTLALVPHHPTGRMRHFDTTVAFCTGTLFAMTSAARSFVLRLAVDLFPVLRLVGFRHAGRSAVAALAQLGLRLYQPGWVLRPMRRVTRRTL